MLAFFLKIFHVLFSIASDASQDSLAFDETFNHKYELYVMFCRLY